jgi:hypothetical protein
VAKVNVAFAVPAISVHVVPFVLTCQCTVGTGSPVAAEIKVAFVPAHRVCDDGCTVTAGPTTGPW